MADAADDAPIPSIDELHARAKVTLDPARSVQQYIRAAQNTFREATAYHAEGQLARAYELFLRFSTLILEELPKHPDYRNAQHQTMLALVKKNCKEALTKLEMLKPVLEVRYKAQQRRLAAAETQPATNHAPVAADDQQEPPPAQQQQQQQPLSLDPKPMAPYARPSTPADLVQLPELPPVSPLFDTSDMGATAALTQVLESITLGTNSNSTKKTIEHLPPPPTVPAPKVNPESPAASSPPQPQQPSTVSSSPPATLTVSSAPAPAHAAFLRALTSMLPIELDPQLANLFPPLPTAPYPPFAKDIALPNTIPSPAPSDPDAHLARFENMFPAISTPQTPAAAAAAVSYPSVSSVAPNPNPAQVAYLRPAQKPLPKPPVSVAPAVTPNRAVPPTAPPLLPPKPAELQVPRQPPPVPMATHPASKRPPAKGPKPDIHRVLGRLENRTPLRTMFIPSDLIAAFERIAEPNTRRNIETCGVLCGTIFRGELYTTHLVIPFQEGTPDTVTTVREEVLFAYQDAHNLLTLAWVHTHPTQTCFLSSVDLHMQVSYQAMLPEAVALVLSPRHTPRLGVFRLTNPPGLEFIQKCPEHGTFHPHPDHLELYTDADARSNPGVGHVVFVSPDMAKIKVVDLRDTP